MKPQKVERIKMMMMMSLSAEDTDIFKKKIQLLLEEAGKSLGGMIGLNITLQPLDFVDNNQVADVPDFFEDEAPLLAHTKFKEGGGVSLPFSMLLKSLQAKVLANYMLGGSGVSNDNPLSEMEQSAVGEAVNQMMNGAFFKLSANFSKRVDVASSEVSPFEGEEQFEKLNPALLRPSVYSIHGNYTLTDGTTRDSLDFVILLPLEWVRSFVSLYAVEEAASVAPPPALFDISGIMAPGTTLDSFKTPSPQPVAATSASVSAFESQSAPSVSAFSAGGSGGNNAAVSGPPQGSVSTPPPPQFSMNNAVQSSESVTVQPVQFGNLESSVPHTPTYDSSNLNLMLDIKINLHVELGRTTMNVKEILELGRGTVLELDRLAGEPVDLFANGKLIARGEVVVIEDNFGLRVTSIVSPQERLKA
jgi:flagellar motor switch protein FliN/FliY